MGNNQYLKPIETEYKGYRFRSRLEAKWAIFFDEMGWKWIYEHEGYELPSGKYLPDFFFPDINCFAEVKPMPFTKKEMKKCFELSERLTEETTNCGEGVLLLVGNPEVKAYDFLINGGVFDKVIMVPKYYHKKSYYPFFFNGGNEDASLLDHTGIKEACKKAKGARFEFNERKV